MCSSRDWCVPVCVEIDDVCVPVCLCLCRVQGLSAQHYNKELAAADQLLAVSVKERPHAVTPQPSIAQLGLKQLHRCPGRPVRAHNRLVTVTQCLSQCLSQFPLSFQQSRHSVQEPQAVTPQPG
jgi:hypothetical protein